MSRLSVLYLTLIACMKNIQGVGRYSDINSVKNELHGIIQFQWITSKKIQNLHETTNAMGFMRYLFHYYTQITPLENRGHAVIIKLQAKNSDICTKPLRQLVLWGPSSIITHKISPLKSGVIQFEWITSKKIQNLHETTNVMGFMRYLFHYYTQITPLENGGHTVFIKLQAKNSVICTKPLRQLVFWGPISIISIWRTKFSIISKFEDLWYFATQFERITSYKIQKLIGNWFYEVVFPLLYTNHPLGKRGPRSFYQITSKKFRNLHETPKAIGFLRSYFHYFHLKNEIQHNIEIRRSLIFRHTVWKDYKLQNSKIAQN